MNKQRKCGFVSIVGRPNAGKSTLLNQILEYKISITTPKVQTTRRRILGIKCEGDTQFIFVDTPGIFQAKKNMEKAMVDTAWNAAFDSDLALLIIDAVDREFDQSLAILEHFHKTKPHQKVFIALNKVDEVLKKNLKHILLEKSKQLASYPNVTDVFMISATKGDGIKVMLDSISKVLPESPWLYPDDQLTDISQRLWAAEMTREQLILHLRQELPYETFVETEAYEEFDNGSLKISQIVYVAKANQKQIILGAKGAMLKRIGQKARFEMEKVLEHPVHLFLYVKVMEKWMEHKNLNKLIGTDPIG